jgi:hypothetical protein
VEIANAAAEAQDQDDDMLYGPPAKITRAGLFSRGALSSDVSVPDHRSKPNALFGNSGSRTTQATKVLPMVRVDGKVGQASQDVETSSQVSTVSTLSRKSARDVDKVDIPTENASLAVERSEREEDDTDMLYGGATSSKLLRKRTLSQDSCQSDSSTKGLAGGSKRGALFSGRCGSGTRPSVATPAVAITSVPRRAPQGTMQSLFARRQA